MKYLAYNPLDYHKNNNTIHCHNYFMSHFYEGITKHKDIDFVTSINPNGTPNSFKRQNTWDASLIFTGSQEIDNPYGYFYNHNPAQKRFHINTTTQILDIQVLEDMSMDSLVFDDALEMYKHPNLIKLDPNTALMQYLKDKKVASLKAIGGWINRDTEQEIVMPCMYATHIKNAGLDMFQDMRFVRFEPSMAERHIVTDDEIYSVERPYDIFIVGSQIPFIYPFRYLAGKNLIESNKFKILNVTKNYGIYDALRTHTLQQIDKVLASDRDTEDLQAIFNFMEQQQYETYLKNMTKCKLMVSCSSIFGYPLYKYYEAMARGTVLITTDVRFPEEFAFKAGVHYVKCEPNDVVDVAQELIQNDAMRLKIANNAVNLIRDHFSLRNTTERFLQHLK